MIQPIDSFFKFISQDLIELITDQTNIYGKQCCVQVQKGGDIRLSGKFVQLRSCFTAEIIRLHHSIEGAI